MALITNNISGSSADSWRLGITGSVIFANPGPGVFPRNPGADSSFFVSGSIGGKGTSGTAIFGGDTVVSGSLTIGTGSITITSNEIIFQGGLAKIYSNSSGLVFEDSSGIKTLSSIGTGGGGGDSIFTAASNTAAYTTSSIAIGQAAAASTKGSDVFLFVSGSTEVGGSGALFGGNLVTSGSVTVKGASGASVASISTGGVISGSSDLQAGGNLTVAGTSALVGDVTVSGDLAVNGATSADITTTTATATLFNANATTVNFAGAGTDINVGSATGNAYLKNATTNVSGALTVAGQINANNGTLATNQTTFNLVNANATTVNFAGAGTTVNIGASSGRTTINNSLTVKGDLYVSGTTTTIDSTVTEIQDPVIGLGFASGSIALSAGDRGFIGGITGAGNNVAFVWSNSNTSFVATKTTSSPTGSVSTAVDITQLQPVRASRFDVGGTTAYVTSSNGTTLTLDGNIIEFDPNTGGAVDFKIATTPYLQFRDGGAGNPAQFGAVGGKQLNLSGSIINLNAGSSGFNLQLNNNSIGFITGTLGPGTGLKITAGGSTVASELVLSGSTVTIGAQAGSTTIKGGTVIGDVSTQNLFNTVSTTINFAGAGTDINVGSSAGGSNTFLKNATTNVSGVLRVAGDINANSGTVTTTQSTFNLINSTATTVNFAGAGTNINIGATTGILYLKNATTNISGSVLIANNSTLGADSTDKIYFSGSAASSLIPDANNAYDLGSPNNRWRNMYTGDLHLRNERGDWTIIEEREYLTITNNHSGRRYKFMLEEI